MLSFLQEVLRNKIISEVKQSVVLQEEGSERMKLKDLSDAIFQDIGSKIMGEISDEVWKVIQSNETDIQGTVKAVYNRILNPEKIPEPSSKKLREGKDEQVLATKTATTVAVEAEDDDPEEPPGFGFGNSQRNNIGATKPPMNLENRNEAKPNGGEPAAVSNPGDEEEDPEVPPGFG